MVDVEVVEVEVVVVVEVDVVELVDVVVVELSTVNAVHAVWDDPASHGAPPGA